METLRDYALSLLGTPYKWGGNNPIEGLDCSGLVIEILKSAGIHFPGRPTAQSLYNYFDTHGSYNQYSLGSLAFYGADATHVDHVAFCLDSYRMLEAGGGDHTVLTRLDAAAKNAFAKIRLIKCGLPLVAVIKPNYATIGIS